MTAGLLGLIQLTGLAAAGFGVMGAIGAALLYPMARSRLARRGPEGRARGLLVWMAAPWACAALLTAACFLPSALGMLGVVGDHCLVHDDHHVHLCLVHRPDSFGSTFGWAILWLTAALGLGALGRQYLELHRTRRLIATLVSAGRRDEGRGVRWIDVQDPLSIAAGFRRGEVLVSSSLARSLPADALEVVLAHERAHLERRDGLWRLVARALSIGHLPPTRRCLLADFTLATEQACDEVAAHRLGDRLRVADAIVAVERLFRNVTSPPWTFAPSFGGSDVAARVESLLGDRRGGESARMRRWLLALVVLAVLGSAAPLHHATETALALIAR